MHGSWPPCLCSPASAPSLSSLALSLPCQGSHIHAVNTSVCTAQIQSIPPANSPPGATPLPAFGKWNLGNSQHRLGGQTGSHLGRKLWGSSVLCTQNMVLEPARLPRVDIHWLWCFRLVTLTQTPVCDPSWHWLRLPLLCLCSLFFWLHHHLISLHHPTPTILDCCLTSTSLPVIPSPPYSPCPSTLPRLYIQSQILVSSKNNDWLHLIKQILSLQFWNSP